MRPFTVHVGTLAPLRRTDVDTDQIFPSRFARPQRRGFEDALFADWRAEPGFVLEQPRFEGATILVAGRNFGTGSSREYAAWAIRDYGFRVVIAPNFGDIFKENMFNLGLLCVALPESLVARMWSLAEAEPATETVVDLERCVIEAGDLVVEFDLEVQDRARLLAGADEIETTLRCEADIRSYEGLRSASLPRLTRARSSG